MVVHVSSLQTSDPLSAPGTTFSSAMSYRSGAEYYTPLRTEDSERPRPPARTSNHIPYGGCLDFTPAGPDSYTYTYRYGQPGLVGLLQNKYTFACALFASIGGLTFGYDQGVIANVLVMKDFLERWPDVGPWEKGLMSTYCFIYRLRRCVFLDVNRGNLHTPGVPVICRPK